MAKLINSKGTVVTEKDFKDIKKLWELGLTAKEVQKFSQRSEGTCWAVKKTDTFAGYKALMRAKYEKSKTEVLPNDFVQWVGTENKKVRPVPSLKLPTEENKVVIELKRIAIALERLVEVADKKKRLF